MSIGRYGILLGLLLAGAGLAQAAEIYQWKDAAGKVHYTDNPMNVPAQYRDQKRDVRPLQGIETKGGGEIPGRPVSEMKALWLERCASCHHMGEGKKGGLVGLKFLIINRNTNFPNSTDAMVRRMRAAASGRIGDMDPIEISDADLLMIAQYLLDAQGK